MKKQVRPLALNCARKVLFLCILLTFFAGKAFATSTFTWKGTGGNNLWENASNWTKVGFPASSSTWPGQSSTTDIVQIGTTTYSGAATQPNLSHSYTIASLTFGDNDSGAGSNDMTLTINSGAILIVTGTVTQDHDSQSNDNINTTITGLGTLSCATFTLGDATTPASPGSSNTFTTTMNSTITALNVSGTLNINSEGRSRFGNTNKYNPIFNLVSGTLTVNDIATKDNNFVTGNTCTFNMDIGATANTLILTGATMFGSTNATTTVIDFVGAGTLAQSTVVYGATSGTQIVYTTTDAAAAGINTTPTMYPNLTFTNTVIRTLDGGALTVGGNLTNNTGSTLSGNATAGSTVTVNGTTNNIGTLNVNNDNWTFTGAVTNSGSYLPGTGTGTSTFSNGLTNSGTFTGGAGIVTITAGTGTLTNNSPGAVTGGAGTITIGTLTNNTGGNVNGNATAGTIKVNLTTGNAGTITVNNGTMNFAGLVTNTGSYLPGTGTGTSTFSNGLTNSGTFTGGAGTVTITAGTGTLTNTNAVNAGAGTISIATLTNTSPGIFTGSTTGGATNISLATGNTGTITVNAENMTFTGLVTNSGTYTGGAGLSKFNGGLTNTGPVAAGAGAITITNLTNNSPGSFTGNSTAATTTISGTLTNGGTITVNNENITVTSAATNTGTVAAGTGTGAITFGNSYTNSGTFNASAIFNAAGNQTIADNSTNGTTFTNVQFQGGGTKTLGGSKGFILATTGVLTLSGSTTLDCGGILTLSSDATSSATIAAIPAGSDITGVVNVQRLIQGGAGKRGYRLVTSTVYTGSDPAAGGANVFDFNYLTNSILLSGPGYAANGFSVTTTQNPSIYLFREDITPPAATTVFTTGYNWKGVARINNSPLYNIGTQTKNQTANVLDTTTTIPVGNGFLLFFRGDKTTNLANKTTVPFATPEDVTLTETGKLNTHTINVRLWYSNSGNNLGNGLYFTSTTNTGTSLRAGYALVANPYASTINWEKYNRAATKSNSSIYGGASAGVNLPSTIYMFNQLNDQYESYIQKAGVIVSTDTTTTLNPGITSGGTAVSNFIASGQAFFVVASVTGQTLSFRETAKVNTQPNITRLNKLLGTPKELTAKPEPVMHLQLKKDSVNTDAIAIRMGDSFSSKFNIYEDAEDLGGGSGSQVSLSSFSSDSAILSINSIPFPGKQQQVIRILADAIASGSYQMSMTDVKDLPTLYSVWLKDAFTADSVQLKLNTSYPFTIDKSNAATFGSNRFTVVIRQDSAFAYKLLDFTATKVDHQSDVQLVWKTANEENYTNLTVERSTDNGKTFNVVGGKPGTGAGNYSLVDKNPDKGRNLYRLKQQDINDSVTYSKVIDVQFGNLFSGLHIFPNPATHTINLAIAAQGYYGCHYSIKFINSSGRVVKAVESSEPEWQGNISYLQPGTYLVRVINNKTQNLIGENKFVKL